MKHTISILTATLTLMLAATPILIADDFVPIRIAILGDRTGEHVPGIYGQCVAEIERLRPDFVMTVGDHNEGYNDDTSAMDSEWAEFDSIVAPLTMPLHLTPGNHDIWGDNSLEYFKNRFGEPNYSFDFRDLHVTVFDDARVEREEELPADQLAWLETDLGNSTAQFKIVFMHKPLWYNAIAEGRPDTLHAIFMKYDVDAVFTGHFHEYFSGTFDGILYTCIGSSGAGVDPGKLGTEYQYGWVTVDKDGIRATPINLGSVEPWDMVKVEESKMVNDIRYLGVQIDRPVELMPDMTLQTQSCKVTLRNIHDNMPIVDTISWNLTDGWTVDPSLVIASLAPGEGGSYEFMFAKSGSVFPLPEMKVTYPVAPGKSITYQTPLTIGRKAECRRIDSKVKIDGDLSEYSAMHPESTFFAPNGGTPQTDPVDFYFAWDDDNLYLAARCRDSAVDSIVAKVTDHDASVFSEDCVGYFIQPDISRNEAYQVYISAIGTVFDQKIWLTEDGYATSDKNWDGRYEVATAKSAGEWTMEARIPLTQWDVHPKSGSEMGLNFRRKQARLATACDWITPIDYDPRRYGRIELK